MWQDMEYSRSMLRKPYIDVLHIESIPDAVDEALRMLRQGIYRAMSYNVDEQRAQAAALASSSSTHNSSKPSSASSHTSRDPLAVYSAVTKRPRKVVGSVLSSTDAPTSDYESILTPTALKSSAGSENAPGCIDKSPHPNSGKDRESSFVPKEGISETDMHQTISASHTDSGLSMLSNTTGNSDQKVGMKLSSKCVNSDSDDGGKKLSVFQPSAKRERRIHQVVRINKPEASISTPSRSSKSVISAPALSLPSPVEGMETAQTKNTLLNRTSNATETNLRANETNGRQPSLLQTNAVSDAGEQNSDAKGVSSSGVDTDSQTDDNLNGNPPLNISRKRNLEEIQDPRKRSKTSVFSERIATGHERVPTGLDGTEESKGATPYDGGGNENMSIHPLNPPTSEKTKSKETISAGENGVSAKGIKLMGEALKRKNGSEKGGKKTDKPSVPAGGISKANKTEKPRKQLANASSNTRLNGTNSSGKSTAVAPKGPLPTDLAGSIETLAGAAAALSGAGHNKRVLKGSSGKLLSSLRGNGTARTTSPVMALLRKKMNEGASNNSSSSKGASGAGGRNPTSNGINVLPKAQRDILAQRGGVLALGTHTVGHRGGGFDGNAPVATTEPGDGVKRTPVTGKNEKMEIQFVPGSKSINGVEPNGYTVSSSGEVCPKITNVFRPKVLLKMRQTAVEGLFKAWKDDAKLCEADALQKCLQTEQEIYAGCASRIDYRAAMVGKLKEIRNSANISTLQ